MPDSASLSEVNDTYKVALEDVNEVLGTAAKISPYTQKAEQAAKLSERRRAAMHLLTQRREQAELQALQASTKPQSSGNQAVVGQPEKDIEDLVKFIEGTSIASTQKKKSSGRK